jgi:site-specific DNA-adenine methylase
MKKTKLAAPLFRTRQSGISSAVIDNFPADYEKNAYLEPFASGISVLLSKARSVEETVNDPDAGVVRILRVLRDLPKEFVKRLRRTKCTEETFIRALNHKQDEDEFDGAVAEFVLRRMGQPGTTKFRFDPGWEKSVQSLPQIAERLQGVNVYNRPSGVVLHAHNEKTSLCYCCLLSAETIPEKLLGFRGKMIVTGDHQKYHKVFSEWKRVDLPEVSATLWKNY